MAYALNSGIQISIDNINWYSLTDHNRTDIKLSPEIIEKSERMADGTMRKYVVAKKHKVSTSWTMIPSKSNLTVDNNKSSAWLEAFYFANSSIPIYIKITGAFEQVPTIGSIPTETFVTGSTTSQTLRVFITSFSKTIKHRNVNADFVDMDIEFTEI